jgi:hypothetical protein
MNYLPCLYSWEAVGLELQSGELPLCYTLTQYAVSPVIIGWAKRAHSLREVVRMV